MDDLHATDKKGYDEYIKKQSTEWEESQKKAREEKEKKRIITPHPLCCIKILVSKIVVQK